MVLVHQSFVGDIIGEGGWRWLRRNSEAYLLLLLIPLFWELFAPRADPVDPVALRAERPASWKPLAVGWFVAMGLFALVLQNSSISEALNLPPSIITFAEAFIASGVVTAYLAWSRGLFGDNPSGAPVVSVAARAGYYVTVALLTLLFHQSFASDIFGSTFATWWTQNAEAYGAMLVVPLWFDFVAGKPWPKSLILTAGWIVLLMFIPFVLGSTFVDVDLATTSTWDDFSIWIGRTTEAFLAAIVIGLYFWVWRRLPRMPWSAKAE